MAYFLEFLPLIQAVQVAVSDDRADHVLYCSNAIYCKKEDQENAEIVSWASPQLSVASYLDLKLIHGEAIHVRFRSKAPQRSGVGSAKILDDNYEDFTEGAENYALMVKCDFCHSCFTQENYCFRRVLPLPSETWREFTGNIFCHAHGDNIHSPTALLPKEGDCLVSESSVLIRRSAVNDDRIAFIDERNVEGKGLGSSKIVCARCHSGIGDEVSIQGNDQARIHVSEREKKEASSTAISSTFLHLQRSQLLLENSSSLKSAQDHPSVSAWRHIEAHFARKLYATSKSKALFRFIVQDGTKRNYLCLWMLNVISEVVYNSHPAENVYNQFLDIDATSIGSPASECTATALKLLYVSTLAENGNTDSSSTAHWRSDSSVEPLELASKECLQLLLILTNNNRAIPPSKQVANGFKVGFLRITEHT